MVLANDVEARLTARGWVVLRPELTARGLEWEDYLRWVARQSRRGVPVLELHGQGPLPGMATAMQVRPAARPGVGDCWRGPAGAVLTVIVMIFRAQTRCRPGLLGTTLGTWGQSVQVDFDLALGVLQHGSTHPVCEVAQWRAPRSSTCAVGLQA